MVFFNPRQDWCGQFTRDGASLLLGCENGAVRACRTAEIIEARAAVVGAVKQGPAPGPARFDPFGLVVPGGHVGGVWDVAASPDGKWIATAGEDHTVNLWDVRSHKLLRTFQGHSAQVWSVAFSPDSKRLASGSTEVKVWDIATGRELHNFEGHTRLVFSLAFHPKEPWLVSGGLDGAALMWDVETGKSLGLLHQFDRGSAVARLAFRPDGRWLAAAVTHRGVALWDFQSQPARPSPPTRILEGHVGQVWAVGFSADGRYFASGADQGVIILRDAARFDRIATLNGDTGQIRSVSFSRDSGLLAGAAYATPTILWDLDALRRKLGEMGLNWKDPAE